MNEIFFKFYLKVLVTQSCLFEIPWTIAHQALLSVGFSRQEYWSGLPCPPPGDRPNPGIEPRSPALQATLYHLNHLEAQRQWTEKGNRLLSDFTPLCTRRPITDVYVYVAV